MKLKMKLENKNENETRVDNRIISNMKLEVTPAVDSPVDRKLQQ